MPFRLGELARSLSGRLHGDPDREVDDLRTLEHAGPRDLSFWTDPRYRRQAQESRAGALIVARYDERISTDQIECDAAEVAVAQALALLHPEEAHDPGIHPTAAIAPDARVDSSATIGPYVVVGAGSEIGARTVVHPHVTIGRRCRIGAGCVLHPQVVLYDDTELGERTVVHSGTVLGADGFRYVAHAGALVKVPHVGRVRLGSDVEIGANSAVDRAMLEATTVGDGTKIDNLVQVGHNVRIGRSCILCGQTALAGSAVLGDGVVLGGRAGVADHLQVGDGVQVAGGGAVLQSVPPGKTLAGFPAIDIAQWRRQTSLLARLPEIRRRLRALERQLARDEAKEGEEENGGAGS